MKSFQQLPQILHQLGREAHYIFKEYEKRNKNAYPPPKKCI